MPGPRILLTTFAGCRLVGDHLMDWCRTATKWEVDAATGGCGAGPKVRPGPGLTACGWRRATAWLTPTSARAEQSFVINTLARPHERATIRRSVPDIGST